MTPMHWTLDDLPWSAFDASRLDPDTLKVIKAASLVEFGGGKYGRYLCNVFHDDPAFQQAARDWAAEEVRHGEALGRYAELADPSFTMRDAYARFEAGYSFELDTARSVRGSRAGELVARCVVETGTSSYYTAIADAVDEPLLRSVCRHIAADELRHYKLFYTHLKRYLDLEALSRSRRARIVLRRLMESEDDELSYAYFAANAAADAVYTRREYGRLYMERAYRFYRPIHIDRAVAMGFKACGLRPHTRWHDLVRRALTWSLRRKTRDFVKAAERSAVMPA